MTPFRLTDTIIGPISGSASAFSTTLCFSYRRRCGAMTLRNSLELMILVFFQNFGKCCWLPVSK